MANRWDSDRECYLDLKGNIVDEERQREQARKAEEEELKSKKVDDGIIDTTKELTAENSTKMADKVLMVKELEVHFKSPSKSTNKVSGNRSSVETGKTEKGKTESDCKNCMKDCKVCRTNAYLTVKKTGELAAKVKTIEDQIINHDKLVRASNERIKELTKNIEKDKSGVERFRKENEKLIHENRQLSENLEKLKRTIKVFDERNSKTSKENFQLSGVLQTKER
ncbi:hypothetical protein Hanom_Chr05g00405811 [Helianthus anomalus]